LGIDAKKCFRGVVRCPIKSILECIKYIFKIWFTFGKSEGMCATMAKGMVETLVKRSEGEIVQEMERC